MKQLFRWLTAALIAFAGHLSGTSAVGEEAKDQERRFSLDVSATPPEQIRVPEGFDVELVRTIPKEKEGSWVSLCVDPKGRLIASDQYGWLYRVTLLKGDGLERAKVEKIPVEIRAAQGLLWAFDSLYVVVNAERKRSGLYRVRDTDGDDVLDSVELLRHLNGDGEHGPHSVVLNEDGTALYVVCGNNTRPTNVVESRVPEIWDQDRLLPRLYGVGFNFMARMPAPAGAVYKVSPDGKKWERVSSGFRNPYDIAHNADGELFTFDSDMEWDIGTPWHVPTRVCHIVSGSEWGWRDASAKWPEYFADTLPPVVNVGLSSPTGIIFGYGAKFPAKYQKALFICDWTYGNMYAVHLEPRGGSYDGTIEEFMMGTPLPLTDVVINPHDGAMYFIIGGRVTQSGLYRLTYRGSESTDPVDAKTPESEERKFRRELESLHVGHHADAVKKAWPYLGHPDRFVRYAARTAIEHRPRKEWERRALAETNPQAAITAIIALARKVPRKYKPTGSDFDTPPPSYPTDGTLRHGLQPAVLAALGRVDWASLTAEQRLDLLRGYELALYRLGPPDEAAREELIARLDPIYPTGDRRMDVMLTEIMCYLQAPSAAAKGTMLLSHAATKEGQLDLVRSLQHLKTGWTIDLHRNLFKWFAQARDYRGGVSFATYIKELHAKCLANTSAENQAALAEIINAKPSAETNVGSTEARPVVKEWTMEELVPLVETKLTGRNFARGRSVFATAKCFACHYYAGEGGAVGPDLTGLAGRFSSRDILESVLEPNKTISDQYSAWIIVTMSGKTIVGRITKYKGEEIVINTNMEDPNDIKSVKRGEIESMERSDISMMPEGLLNTLHEEEVLDLIAFLLSRGDAKNPMFTKEAKPTAGVAAAAVKSVSRGGDAGEGN